MSKKQKKTRKRWIFLLLLLALLCIGGVELAVCHRMDPDLYARITQPVSTLWFNIRSHVSDAVHSLQESLSTRLTAPPSATPTPEPPENQLAGAPSIDTQLVTADPAITELAVRDGAVYLTGGSIELYYFNQGAPEWADLPYGRDNIGSYGCGPTAMAMAVSSMTDQFVDPSQMAQWAVENGYWASGSGSYLSIVEGTAHAYGLTATPVETLSVDTLLRELSSGKLMVALMTAGHFTNGGHFILLRGTTLDGSILVADPNSEARSLATWDPQLILDELSASRSNGAPLWLISP